MDPEKMSLPSLARTAIFDHITAQGATGATHLTTCAATGLDVETVRVHIKNMLRCGDVFGGKEPGSRPQVYLLPDHLLAYQNAQATPATQRTPNLPPRTTTVTVIKTAQQRSGNLSPERVRIERLLAQATTPLTPLEVAQGAGLQKKHSNRILQGMRHEGRAVNVGVGKEALWRAAGAAPAPAHREPRVCNASQPTMRHSLSLQPARADALQHLEIKSRRGDQLVPAMPPMLIGSGIGGGMR
jgi:hypothetical protein